MHQIKPSLKKQRGAASLIFVLLVALVITASTNEAVKSIRNSQDIGTAVNATSHAQTGLWVAADAMRAYFETLSSTQLDAVGSANPAIPITMDASYGTVIARIIDANTIAPNTNYQIEVELVNRHAASKSSAKMNVVYTVTITQQTPVIETPTATVQFSGGLTVSGGIELLNGGEPIDLAVDGDISITGVSVNPINDIYSTGKVTIGSKVTVDSIYADDDVLLANTTALIVRTLGTLTTTGDATVVDTIANSDVFINSSGRFEQISTQKNIYVNSGGSGQGVLIAGENIVAKQTGSIDSANAIGNITMEDWFNVDYATAMGDINCVSTNWKDTITLSANGSLNDCPSSDATITAISGASSQVVPYPELEPLTLPTTEIDVWKLNDDTNYFVEYDTTADRMKVTVNNVNGLTDGQVYYLGDYSSDGSGPYYDHLCTSVNASGTCTAPTTPTLPLCYSWGPWNRCITYQPWSNTFVINPNNTVPGIVFFDGNVTLGNGHSMSTILASGNITTGNSFKHWGANRGAYEKVCEGNADHAPSSVRARYTAAYSTHYPTNLCDIANGEYTPLSIGNVAMAAGGINPDTTKNPNGDYTGGDIDLEGSTDIWGAVLAGNYLTSNSGQVSIKGLVNAGAYGDPDSGGNTLSANTTIELQATDDYDPLDIPTEVEVPPPPPVFITDSQITWSRPL